MTVPQPIDIADMVSRLGFLPDRTPATSESDADWVAGLGAYRDGGIFAVHYAGESEWERHAAGDEIVMVIDGETTMTLLVDGQEHQHTLGSMQLIVVPQGTWHRFDTPRGVKVLTVTPQPTDHSIQHPLG